MFLRGLGHDVVRVNEILTADATDREIVATAAAQERAILTQDLDFSDIIALSGRDRPSLLTLRLSSSRIEHVNAVLEKVLPAVEGDLLGGAIVTVKDTRIRRRALPVQ